MLLLIDMQVLFNGSQNQNLIYNTLREIKVAKRYKQHIIDLRYKRFGPLQKPLAAELFGYAKHHKVWKGADDGSVEIYDYVVDNIGVPNKIKICGIYGEYCVRDTTEGLSVCLKNTQFLLIEDCIGFSSVYSNLDWVNTLQNCQVITRKKRCVV